MPIGDNVGYIFSDRQLPDIITIMDFYMLSASVIFTAIGVLAIKAMVENVIENKRNKMMVLCAFLTATFTIWYFCFHLHNYKVYRPRKIKQENMLQPDYNKRGDARE